MTRANTLAFAAACLFTGFAHAQQATDSKPPAADATPAANPARPTVTNPATLPPTGYLQFEQGYNGALNSPETDTQYGVVQTTKIALQDRVMVQVQSQPFARSVVDGAITHDTGDLDLGGELVLFTPKESEDDAVKEAKDKHRHSYVKAATPTVTIGYLGRVRAGTSPDLDVGGFSQSFILLASGHMPFLDVHYDANFLVNEQTNDALTPAGSPYTVRRAQFAQTFSVDRPISDKHPNLQFAGEIYHFTQPFVTATSSGQAIARANAVAFLFSPSYQLRPNLILDCGFSHGLTSTSTRWQSFVGFTYLLPHRLWPDHKAHT